MNKEFQISLAAARVNAKLSQDDVTKMLKISKTTLVNWEKGVTEPKIEQARSLSELYKMPLENIAFGSD